MPSSKFARADPDQIAVELLGVACLAWFPLQNDALAPLQTFRRRARAFADPPFCAAPASRRIPVSLLHIVWLRVIDPVTSLLANSSLCLLFLLSLPCHPRTRQHGRQDCAHRPDGTLGDRGPATPHRLDSQFSLCAKEQRFGSSGVQLHESRISSCNPVSFSPNLRLRSHSPAPTMAAWLVCASLTDAPKLFVPLHRGKYLWDC